MAVSASEQKAKLSTPWEVKKVETKAEKKKKEVIISYPIIYLSTLYLNSKGLLKQFFKN